LAIRVPERALKASNRFKRVGKETLSIVIKLPKYLLEKTDIQSKVPVEGTTVRECFEALIRAHPSLEGEILDRQNLLLLKWMIYVNEKLLPSTNELSSPVEDGDVILLLPVVDGG
jgi:molybdopterin converting factor small subunit